MRLLPAVDSTSVSRYSSQCYDKFTKSIGKGGSVLQKCYKAIFQSYSTVKAVAAPDHSRCLPLSMVNDISVKAGGDVGLLASNERSEVILLVNPVELLTVLTWCP